MAQRTTLPPLTRADGSPVRVLVVDDEPNLTELVAMALRYEGWDVRTAATGTEAVRTAREFSPDAVVLDMMLPDIDGLEILRRMRADEPEVPVLFLPARDAVEDRVAGGEEEDRLVPLGGPQARGDLEAVDVGEHDVEDDEVGLHAVHGVDGALPVARDLDLETREAQGGREQLADVGLVLDDEQVGARLGRGGVRAHPSSVRPLSGCGLDVCWAACP